MKELKKIFRDKVNYWNKSKVKNNNEDNITRVV